MIYIGHTKDRGCNPGEYRDYTPYPADDERRFATKHTKVTKNRKDILTQRAQRDTEEREYYNGDRNRKNIFTKENEGNEIVASASQLPALPAVSREILKKTGPEKRDRNRCLTHLISPFKFLNILRLEMSSC
jgi:hypothetical protein